MPAVLVHGWMPDAYRAAPLPVLVLLSGVLSKVGAYGFLRVVLPLYPRRDGPLPGADPGDRRRGDPLRVGDGVHADQRPPDRRLLVDRPARLHHVGIFSLRSDGADGAVLQMVNHGLVVARVFLIVALLAERAGSEDLRRLGGLAMRAPVLAAIFLIVTLATLAMPGSANFIGEFYILIGVFQSKIAYAFVAAIGVALAAFYALRLFQRTMHNRKPEGDRVARDRRCATRSCWRRWSPASSAWRSTRA